MSIVIYSDESGTHQNRYLVIAALITKDQAARKRHTNIMRRKLAQYKRDGGVLDELHASELTIPRKQDILNLLSKKNDYEVAYLVADKKHLTKELKDRPNLCFNYLFNMLFERIVKRLKEDMTIICDQRSISAGSKNSLPEYIQTEAYANWSFKGVISFTFADSRDYKGLQMVDIVANTIYAKYNSNKSHLYDLQNNHVVEKILFPYKLFGT